MGFKEIGLGVKVQCQGCLKVGDDHEIMTLMFPDEKYRTLCKECREREGF